MSATYNEMLKRLIEERKRLGLSQQQMARFILRKVTTVKWKRGYTV